MRIIIKATAKLLLSHNGLIFLYVILMLHFVEIDGLLKMKIIFIRSSKILSKNIEFGE